MVDTAHPHYVDKLSPLSLSFFLGWWNQSCRPSANERKPKIPCYFLVDVMVFGEGGMRRNLKDKWPFIFWILFKCCDQFILCFSTYWSNCAQHTAENSFFRGTQKNSELWKLQTQDDSEPPLSSPLLLFFLLLGSPPEMMCKMFINNRKS